MCDLVFYTLWAALTKTKNKTSRRVTTVTGRLASSATQTLCNLVLYNTSSTRWKVSVFKHTTTWSGCCRWLGVRWDQSARAGGRTLDSTRLRMTNSWQLTNSRGITISTETNCANQHLSIDKAQKRTGSAPSSL